LPAPRLGVRSLRMQRVLVIVGCCLVVIGLLWPLIGRLPLGRLPGDFVISRPGLRLYFPLTTMLIVSIVLSLLLRLFRR
jgi:hypothetical protein